MFKSVLIAVLGVGFCVCKPPMDKPTAVSNQSEKTHVSISDEWNTTIFDHMSKNKEVICPDSNTYIESEYVKDCKGIKFPKSTTNVSLDESKLEFLCVGIYDRIAKMCYAGSTAEISNAASPMPKNTKEFDDKVKNIIVNTNALKFCESWKNDYPPRYSDLKKWINLLDKALYEPVKCIKICTNNESKLLPICAVIKAMDTIAANTFKENNAPKEENVKETTKNIISKTEIPTVVVKHEEVSKEVSKEISKIPVSEIIVEKSNEESTPRRETSSKSKDNDKILNNDAPKNSPINSAQQPETVSQNSPPPVIEDSELPPQSLPEDIEKKEKIQKPKEETAVNSKKVEKNPTVDASGNDKKSEDQAPVQEIPNVENDGASHEDEILESEGVISHPTQDQENPDAAEDINEMPQPQGSLSEDAEESPPMPSDKREYIPRLPGTRNDDDSHFFSYFTVIGVIFIAGYVGYHNKQKILAMLVEGRRSRGGRGRRRPSTANYRKLDCTLEEAVTSQCNSNVTHVIY